jgi:hypothetical protein
MRKSSCMCNFLLPRLSQTNPYFSSFPLLFFPSLLFSYIHTDFFNFYYLYYLTYSLSPTHKEKWHAATQQYRDICCKFCKLPWLYFKEQKTNARGQVLISRLQRNEVRNGDVWLQLQLVVERGVKHVQRYKEELYFFLKHFLYVLINKESAV